MPTISSFTADPATIKKGESSTLSWSVSNADSLSINQGVGTVTGTSVSVSPDETTTYTLTATNSAGSVTATAKVRTVSGTISASPNPCTIAAGSDTCTTTVTWSATGTTRIIVWTGHNQKLPTVLTNSGASGSTSISWIKDEVDNSYTFILGDYEGEVQGKLLDTVTVTGRRAGSLPTIRSFTASPTTIDSGGSSTLSWSVAGADSLSIDQSVGTVTGTSKSVSPTETTTYTLTATNSAGSATATATVSVSVPGAPTISSFTTSSATIISGGGATLRWSVNNATSVSIDQGIGAVDPESLRWVTPSSTTTYTLTATNSVSSVTSTVTITVRQVPNISGFIADPATIDSGGSSTLRWSVSNADSLSIDQGIGTVTGTSISVSPSSTTTYTLTATNESGSDTTTVTVTVRERTSEAEGSISVSECTIYHGETECVPTVSWTSTGADTVQVWYSLNEGAEAFLASSVTGSHSADGVAVEETDTIDYILYDYSDENNRVELAQQPGGTINTSIICRPTSN